MLYIIFLENNREKTKSKLIRRYLLNYTGQMLFTKIWQDSFPRRPGSNAAVTTKNLRRSSSILTASSMKKKWEWTLLFTCNWNRQPSWGTPKNQKSIKINKFCQRKRRKQKLLTLDARLSWKEFITSSEYSREGLSRTQEYHSQKVTISFSTSWITSTRWWVSPSYGTIQKCSDFCSIWYISWGKFKEEIIPVQLWKILCLFQGKPYHTRSFLSIWSWVWSIILLNILCWWTELFRLINENLGLHNSRW